MTFSLGNGRQKHGVDEETGKCRKPSGGRGGRASEGRLGVWVGDAVREWWGTAPAFCGWSPASPVLPLYCKSDESRNWLAPQIMEVADKVGEIR